MEWVFDVKGDDVLLFSIAEAKKVADENGYSDLSFETLILPYVLNLDKEGIKKNQGVNRMFRNKTKFLALNIDYIDNFGANLGEAFSTVLESIKTAIAEAQAQRAIDIAA